jgi:16S rRNA (guanine966-N2)-methyltransferase
VIATLDHSEDLVRESIFNIIKHSNKFSISIEGATILDLFSGVGSFGIEALSRQAKEVTFVENYPKVLTNIRV